MCQINFYNRIIILAINFLCLVSMTQAATFTVNRVLDGSDIVPGDGICATSIAANCTLRAAIEEANAFAGTDIINFDITGGGTVKTLIPASAYPDIAEAITIDGLTQGGVGYMGPPLIELDGSLVSFTVSGLTITAGNSIIRGLVINNFPRNGILIFTNGGNTIESCYIGTNSNGTVGIGNGLSGIEEILTSNNTFGSSNVAKRNVISGNGGAGIGSSGSGNTVVSNYIGTDVTGSIDLGNSSIGVGMTGSNNSIDKNLISGNGFSGISLSSTGNTVIGNKIGTDISGVADLGNSSIGISITSSNNQIGGTGLGESNTIAFNSVGIIVSSNSATGNIIRTNSIFSNDGMGIDLAGNGVTANDTDDPDTGANNLQNYPVVTDASNSGGITTIQSTLNSTPNTPYNVDFYSSPTCDSSGYGEGQTFLGSTTVVTNAGGDASFSFFPGGFLPLGRYITATATRNAIFVDTSEFSECVQVVNGDLIVVINTLDSGIGSLRQAIIDSNATLGLDKITFNIPGAGVQTINLLSALPTISDPVIINGTSQPGFSGMPLIELNGTSAGAGSFGLNITGGGNSTIRSLIINRFDASGIVFPNTSNNNTVTGCFIGADASGNIDLGNSQNGITFASSNNRIGGGTLAARNLISGNTLSGISITGTTASGNVVSGNYIGTNLNGTASLTNSNGGILISGGSFDNTIGGNTAGERNVISGNLAGLTIFGDVTGSGGNLITGNYIGTTADGTAALGNSNAGISINNSQNNRIGGNSANQRNVISGNLGGGGSGGISISGELSSGNKMLGNYIGTDASGTVNLGNASYGIRVTDAANNQIGGTMAGDSNIVAFNGDSGVFIFQLVGTATGNSILGNSIFSNGDLGIDLNPFGITLNDDDDPDIGSNNLQNYPIISGAQPGSTRVIGTLNSTPSTTFRLEFFNSPTADVSGNGEAQFFVGTMNVTTNAGGNVSFDQTFAYNSALNTFVSATATNITTGDTSEFSNAKQVLVPTAAQVSVSGRVLNAFGRGISSARVYITDTNGNTRETRTSSFGYYNFAEVAAGETYILTVSHKRYQFAPQVLFITEDLSEINFIVSPSKY